MVTIEDLVALVPPPERPVDAAGDWVVVEAAIGVRLPSDFKALIARYGLGAFNGLVRLMTPFDPDQTLIVWSDTLAFEGRIRQIAPEVFPYPLYPEPGGLLSWANTPDRGVLYWLTDGDPDDWRVVAYDADDPDGDGHGYEPQDTGAVAFLYEWLNGTRPVTVLPPPEPVPWFTAYTPHEWAHIQLTDGDLPYERQLEILRECLAPTVDRGHYHHEGHRQDGFDAPDRDWWLMYDNTYGHQIRVAYPPGDDDRVRDAIYAAVARMGCQVRGVINLAGAPLWSSPKA